MPNWRSVLGGVDRLVLRAVDFSQRVLLWPAIYALACAAALWPVLHSERLRAWSENNATPGERLQQLNYFLVALAVIVIVELGYVGLRRLRRGRWAVHESAREFNRLFTFTLAGPFIVALLVPSIEVRRPILAMFFVVAATISVLPTVAFLWESVPGRRVAQLGISRPRLRTLAAVAVLGGLCVAYAVWFSRLSINAHHALNTRVFDLAIYDNIFYQSSHENFLGCTLSRSGSHITGHFDPILAILSPLYLIDPRAETILVLQAIWCALGVIPAFLLGRHHLDSAWAGLVFATAWVLYPALHGANLYDFHSLTLLATLLLWLMFFLTTGRFRWFFVLLPLVLLVREDVSLLLCFVAFSALLTREPRLTRVAWATLLVSGIYFVVVKTQIMTGVDLAEGIEKLDPLGGKYGFAWYYTDLIPKKGGLRDLLVALLTNPTFVIGIVMREAKLIYLGQLLLPLAFLPLIAKPWRSAMAFGLLSILLASKTAVYSIHFQYSVVLFPILFTLASIGLRRLRDGDLPARLGLEPSQLVAVMLAAVLMSSVLMTWKFGGILDNDSFRGGFRPSVRSLSEKQVQRYEELRDFVAQIPPTAAVSVIGRVAPHVSNRAQVFRYRHFKPVDYFLMDTRDLKGPTRDSVLKRVESGELVRLDKKGSFELFREIREPKGPPPSSE